MNRGFARERLEALRFLDDAAARAGVELCRQPRDALADSLVARLQACTHTIGAGARLEDYPVVARLLARSTETWRQRSAGLLANLARDGAELGAERPAVEHIVTHFEFLHARRTTLSLTLAGGRRWVYREKDLSAAAWWMGLCAALNPTLSLPLHVRRVVVRDGYSWDEHVLAAPCSDAGQVRRYFVRAGMLVRLLERLAAADFHALNVLAAGEHPVLIDVETFFHPWPMSATDAHWASVCSPLHSGLVTLWAKGPPGTQAVNVGGLHPGGHVVLPFLMPGGVPLTEDIPATIPAPLGEHVDELLAGYAEMEDALTRTPDLHGRLEAARGLPLRVIRTPGDAYQSILFLSMAPALLRSEAARDAWLADQPLAPDERAAVRDLVVPRPGERLFDHPALAQQPPAGPGGRARRADMIRTAVALLDDRPAPPGRPGLPPASDEAIAVALGDAIIGERFTGGEWLGVRALPWMGLRKLDVLSTDLLSGHAGIAVVLAGLYKVTSLPRFRAAALETLEAVPGIAFGERSWPGAHCGLGGGIYGLARCAELLGDGALAEQAQVWLRSYPRRSLQTGPWDVALGVAGLILGALAAGPPPADAVAALAAARLVPPPLAAQGLPSFFPDLETGVAHVLHRCGRRVEVPAGGHLLWRLGLDAAALAEAARRLDETPADPLDDLELALRAHIVSGEDRFLAAARSAGARLRERRRATGRWFPETSVAERHDLSATTGVTAVAHALLRLTAPGTVRSLRLLE